MSNFTHHSTKLFPQDTLDRWTFPLKDLPLFVDVICQAGTAPFSPNQTYSWVNRDRWVGQIAHASGYSTVHLAVTLDSLSDVLSHVRWVVLCPSEGLLSGSALLLTAEKNLKVFNPNSGQFQPTSVSEVSHWLLNHAGAEFVPDLHTILEALQPSERERVRIELVSSIIGKKPVGDAWVLREEHQTGLVGDLRAASFGRRLLLLFMTHLAQYGAFIGAFAIIGKATLNGRTDQGLITAALLLFSTAGLFRVLTSRIAFEVVLTFATLFKRWTFLGALAFDMEGAKRRGAGHLLGTVFDSAAVEQLAVEGVLSGALAAIELIIAIIILVLSPTGLFPGIVLILLSFLIGKLGRDVHYSQQKWVNAKSDLTGELVEGIGGHRSRVIQCVPSRWYERDAPLLNHYHSVSNSTDRSILRFQWISGRSVLTVGLVALLPSIFSGVDVIELAAVLGSIILAHGAVIRLVDVFPRVSVAWLSFQRIRPILTSIRPEPEKAFPKPIVPSTAAPLLEARDIHFRYAGGHRDIFTHLSLVIQEGDRILIEAPSGAGKSTLLSVLSGLRIATGGRLLTRGADLHFLGVDELADRVVSVPQFNDNHVFSGTITFNCLMGSTWPATPEDVAKAERVLRELGLGPLLDAMPSGMEQVVGETGWRMSQGERSRLYVARAILQGADVILIDESFGALDPETFLYCLDYLKQSGSAVVLVAHR